MYLFIYFSLFLSFSICDCAENYVELNSTLSTLKALTAVSQCAGIANTGIVSSPTLDITVDQDEWRNDAIFVLSFTTTAGFIACPFATFHVDTRCVGRNRAVIDYSLPDFSSIAPSTPYCISKRVPIKCSEMQFRVHLDCNKVTGQTMCPTGNSIVLVCVTGTWKSPAAVVGWGESGSGSGWSPAGRPGWHSSSGHSHRSLLEIDDI